MGFFHDKAKTSWFGETHFSFPNPMNKGLCSNKLPTPISKTKSKVQATDIVVAQYIEKLNYQLIDKDEKIKTLEMQLQRTEDSLMKRISELQQIARITKSNSLFLERAQIAIQQAIANKQR